MMSGPVGAALSSEPIVETRSGKVRGARTGQVFTFKGIRYARAARFQAPQPPEPWAGVADALSFGPNAPQTDPHPTGPPPLILLRIPRPEGAPPPVRLPESEDCQVLNIWTSGLGDGRKRAVMVWLHGGFFSGGSGSTVDGSALAAQGDVVVVSINQRVNSFGFTDLSALGGEPFRHSGNAGMLDIIAALEWVREHIDRFGGDPGRVMVFGTSGGGMKTSFLMASPRAKGLIHRAGVQSGPGLRFLERDQAQLMTERLLHALGVPSRDWEALRTMPVEQLLGGYHQVARAYPPQRFIDLPSFAPVIDDDLLPRHPFSPDAALATAHIPMLTGSNGQEMTFFMGNDMAGFSLTEADLESRILPIAGPSTEEVLRSYRGWMPGATPSQRWIQFFSDYSVMLPAMAQATRKAQAGGAGTWLYRLQLRSAALDGLLGATHTLETPLIFDTPSASRMLLGDRKEALALAEAMSSAWRAFAATGDPGAAAGANWPIFEPKTGATMIFGDDGRAVVRPNPDRDRYALLLPLLGL